MSILHKVLTDSGYMLRRGVDMLKSDYKYFKLGVKDSIQNDPKAQADRMRGKTQAIKAGLLNPAKQAEVKAKAIDSTEGY